MSKLGTTQWANRTHGQMSLLDRIALLTQEVQRQLINQLSFLHRNQLSQVGPLDIDAIPIPDSALALETATYSELISPSSLFFHSMRTYFWGSILAKQTGLKLDPELFYVMSLLHDIGLTDAHNRKDGRSVCFAVEGGRGANAFVTQQGHPEKGKLVEEAIIQHINMRVPISDGIERHILPQATALDVVGARIKELDPQTIQAILKRYPRQSFKEDLVTMFVREYQNRPQSRIAFIHQVANLNRLIRNAPFDS